MILSAAIAQAFGLNEADRKCAARLVAIFNQHSASNAVKAKYYEGRIALSEVNLGLALPADLKRLEIGCAWGEKTVDVLAARSMFDGFVGRTGEAAETMTKIVADNRMIAEYIKACRDELKFGCVFATLTRDEAIGCRIRFHSPETAAAEWDGVKGRIGAGLAIIDTRRDNQDKTWRPSVLHLHTDDDVVELRREDNKDLWTAHYHPHSMRRPLMEPLVWNATTQKPFGRSRLKSSVRNLINGYVRTIANATIGLEFATSPQKYLLGVTDEQYEAIINQKFRTYVGSLLTATQNPETGDNPVFGQLQQGTIDPHIAMLRALATQFSAATGLTVTDVGVVNDANPSSSDAILAQSQTLVLMAEQLNAGNGDGLYIISQMAQAIARNVSPDDLTDEERDIMAHFKNPAMPSLAVTADAALKIASARPGFAQTDVFAEMMGFGPADIRRIKAQETRARGLAVLESLRNDSTAE